MAEDETEITRPHEALHEDTQAHEPVVPPAAPPPPPPAAGGPPPPPDARVPPRLVADVWPWLAALGILALAALLVWLFVLNRDSSKGKVVPAVVGLQQQEAIAKLTGDGFNVRAVVGPSPKPAGIVASQKPGGGSRLDKGQTVVTHVSNGHAVGGSTTGAQSTTAQTATAQSTAAQTTTAQTATTHPSAPQPRRSRRHRRGRRLGRRPDRGGWLRRRDGARLGVRHGRLDRPGGSGRRRAGAGRQRRAARGRRRLDEACAAGAERRGPEGRRRTRGAPRREAHREDRVQERPREEHGRRPLAEPRRGSEPPAYTQVTIVVGGQE